MNNKRVYCRYCKNKQEMELSSEDYVIDSENGIIRTEYFFECPYCESRSPIAVSMKEAEKFATSGFDMN